MKGKSGKGRPKLSDSPTIERTYCISEQDYLSFCEWCKSRGLVPSKAIRSLMLDFYVKGMLEDLDLRTLKELKVDEEIQNI